MFALFRQLEQLRSDMLDSLGPGDDNEPSYFRGYITGFTKALKGKGLTLQERPIDIDTFLAIDINDSQSHLNQARPVRIHTS
mmetsp:Transcript_42624/g.100112  ORF Transcript_42624/g.100112 Transcript_42624/m.100112 type:complete len:82 (+) Transcript_42624:162-407(+)|eukprot:3102802-Rhodomonas_salina.2